MTYKDELTKQMDLIAARPESVFIGYGLTRGRALGTLKNVPDHKLIETPVAENLMVGLAVGLALAGRLPVVFFERFDFVLNAADAIVNHLDKLDRMSKGEFKPKVILRVVVGNTTKPLFTGTTHTQNFRGAFREMVSFPIVELKEPEMIEPNYCVYCLSDSGHHRSAMMIEFKDLH